MVTLLEAYRQLAAIRESIFALEWGDLLRES
jgi:hypothetical protein